MILAYTANGRIALPAPDGATLDEVVWIDLARPTPDEEALLEGLLRIDLPTREDMRSIEPSSRLYRDDDAVFLTASVSCKGETDRPETTDVAFILAGARLVTIRYADPKAFHLFTAAVERHPATCRTGLAVLVELLEAIVDRTAEILENVSRDVDKVPDRIFPDIGAKRRRTVMELEETLSGIELLQRRCAKARESLVSLGRLTGYLLALQDQPFDQDLRSRLKGVGRDIDSLSAHASYVSATVGFLLDASLGLISIEQNAIIKFFSVVAVVLLPPTLVGTIYGMNFEHMPELGWTIGYPMALIGMVLSAVVPYVWFRRRGWL